MSTPTVYQLPHSPFCLPVTRALEAFGVAHQVKNIPNSDREEIILLTGGRYYQVPVLMHREEIVFDGSGGGRDGQDVPRYVDRVWGQGRLFPSRLEGLQEILLNHLENEVELVTFKLADIHYVPGINDIVERTLVVRHKERRFGRGCLTVWSNSRDQLWAQAIDLLRPYDRMAENSPFLLGSTPVYTDFALYGLLANLAYNNWNPLPPLPHLQAWYERILRYRVDA
ncbi:MAG TPA: glutathione S-transferase family protein [Candidatus Limnocylindria bacterium]|jgi:glutathione S-transferase|nr:glutathione S-transferase family protein [Candidatus Limnocylindria bacterium]